ncbi:MAG: transporter substrate-binding domain-containing protein [Bacteroidales bacterium]|nr:transporter substrate-binding domain-containing protein [Bacteroidales bacterium]
MKNIKGRIPVIIAVIILILGVGGMMRRCSDTTPSVAVEYHKPGDDTLAVAIEMSPLTYTLRNDTAEGFDYSILRDIAAEHDVTVSFYPFSQLEEAFRGLSEHRYNLVVASIPATKALKEYFPLTDGVYLDKQVLVQRRDSTGVGPISSQEQLRGDTVWIAEGSPFGTRLRNMSKELGDTIYVESSPKYSSEHLAILTALGEVKQAVVPGAVARHIATDYPVLDISTPISFNQFQCWAVAPGDSALLDSLNTWLGQFRETPAFRRLAEKYL